MKKGTKVFAAIFLFLLIYSMFPVADIKDRAPIQNLQEPSHQINASTENMNVLWNKTWGDANNDMGWAVAAGPAGSIYCVGRYQDGYGTSNTALIKYYSNGTQAWLTTWGEAHDETCLRIALDLGGNIYCAGETGDFGQGNWDFLLLKFHANGTFAWSTTWGGSGYVTRRDNARGVAVDATGNIYVAGYTQCFGAGGYDFALVKFYPNSTLAWYQTWGGSGDDVCNQMTMDPAGNLYCVGYTYNFGVVNRDLALVKLYPNGTRAWNTTWGGTQNDEAQSVILDPAGNIYCTGFTNSFGLGLNALALVKFYPNGTRAWNTTWGGSNEDWGYSIALGNEGDLYCLGTTQSYGVGLQDFALVKFNLGGNRLWNATWGGSNQDDGRGIILDASNDIYCVGSTQSYGAGGWDFAVVKIDNAPPTYSSVTESADPLELGNSEIITIIGVMDPSGVQTVRIFFEGTNHTMTNLGGGTWRYSGWAPSNIGNYSYSIYMQDNLGKWNVLSGAILVTLTVVPESSDPKQDEWPMFHGQLNHTGVAHTTPISYGGPFWTHTTGGQVVSSPAVVDERLFVGSSDSKIYCVNVTTGGLLWNYTTGAWVESSPAVAGGRVYVGSGDGKIYCLNADTGELIWNYTTGGSIHSSPAVAGGRVFIGSRDNNIYCLNATTGKLLWSYPTSYWIEASPAVEDERVFVSSWDGGIYCLNATNGGLLWSYYFAFSSPTVANGRVYFGSYDGLYCLNATSGGYLWSYVTSYWVEPCPAVADGRVYLGMDDQHVYCLDATSGSVLWNYTTSGLVHSSAAILDGRIYLGSQDNNFHCLNATTGTRLWSYLTGAVVDSSPAVAGGCIYVGSGDGKVYCLPSILTPAPPTYSTIIESADPVKLGETETITITGVTALSGVQTVLITFEGSNHTMTNLGGGTWQYNLWTTTTEGLNAYTIYMQDNAGNWNATSGLIKVSVDFSVIWNITWGSEIREEALGTGVDKAGNIYCIGFNYNSFASNGDFVLVKFYPNSTQAWNTTWSASSDDTGWDLTLDPAGNLYCVGSAYDLDTYYNLVLFKFYPNGTQAWSTKWKYLPNIRTEGRGVTLDKAGNIFCVGQQYKGSDSDLALVKFYPNGTLAWNTTWGGSNTEMGLNIALDTANNSYCIGYTRSFGAGGWDLSLVKFYPNGTRAWNITWGGSSLEIGYDVVVDPSDNVYCVGNTYSFGKGGGDLCLIKFYPNGTRAWNTTWGGYNGDAGSGVALDTAGNLYCSGQTMSFGAGDLDFAAVKFYANGTRAWNTTWGGLARDYCYKGALDGDSNFYCVGYTESFGAGGRDFAVVKFGVPQPIIIVNSEDGHTYNLPPTMDIDFYGDYALVAGYYKVDSYALTGNSTTGWVQIFAKQITKSYTSDFIMNDTLWNSLREGSHVVYFKASDEGGSFNDGALPSWQFYKDAKAPNYALVSESADPLELGGIEVVTVSGVTDLSGIKQVLIEFEGNNQSMTNLGSGTWRFSPWSPNSTGDYLYKIWIQDNIGNWNMTSFGIRVVDTTPPSYTIVIESIDPLELGGIETIAVSGLADLSGINQVLIEFEGFNHTMMNLGSGTWRYNPWSPNSTGTYPYTIYIQDNAGNWKAAIGSIQIIDTIVPTYISVTESANLLELGDIETITITGVADLSGIQTVRVAFEGSNHTMSDLGNSTWYYGTWIPGSIGGVPYTIYIQDNAENWRAIMGTIQVMSPTAPTYASIIESADQLQLGNPETILISGITDLSGIQTVKISFEGSNHTMTNLGGSDTWYYVGWTPNNTGTYLYTIYIQDNLGNWNAVSGSIEVSTTTATPNQDWLIWLLALVAAGAAFCAIVLYVRLNKKIQKLSNPKAIPPKDLPKKMESL